jgi:hypothetical protein
MAWIDFAENRMKANLINTPLQRGDQRPPGRRNRFNGLGSVWKTVETVFTDLSSCTPLKRVLMRTPRPLADLRIETAELLTTR